MSAETILWHPPVLSRLIGTVMAEETPTAELEKLRQAQAGDTAAFEWLYRRHVGRIYALCLRMTGDRGRAEDLTQDAFLRAWERLGSFHRRSAFGSWLYRLAVNVVLGEGRQRQRRQSKLVAVEEPAELPEPRRRDLESGIDLERGLATLPRMAKLVFLLHDVEGYKHREIGRLEGISEGTSKAHLHRARRLLRRSLR